MRIQLYTSIILLVFAFQSSAQTCAGNLGENIFTEGDFGSGAANVVQIDPQIAPGYTYTTDPPSDGFYIITNDIAVWPQAFGWIEIMDNSPDPEGYMMVVNASYNPSLFYEQEIVGLCENTLYEFSADIINLIKIGTNIIEPNVSFLIDNIVEYETGDIPETEQWETYGFTFTTQPGQTSVNLSLRNNAPGGIGNDIALDNISFRACGPQAFILPENIPNICDNGGSVDLKANIIGNQYVTPLIQWQISLDEGMTWMDIAGANDNIYTHTTLSDGIYYYRYVLANDPTNLQNSKCRIVSNIKMVDVASRFYAITDTLCDGLSFPVGNNIYTETGIYVDTLNTATGCDSIVTLDLTIVSDVQMEAVFNLKNPTCSYFQDGSIILENIVNGVEPFSVFIDNMLSQNDSKFNLSGGDYSYQIRDKYGCATEGILTLETPIPFRVDLGDDIDIQLGETVILNPDFTLPVENFTWKPADIINCDPDCDTPSITPTNSLTIFINATSTMACVSSDSLRINVGQLRDVFIPNVFSPNSDGQNDYFLIFGDPFSIQEIERLTIYDRWGGLIFEQNNFQPDNPAMAWDGTSRGKALNPGLYVYEAQIRFLDGEITKYAGGVTLVR